MLLVEFYWEAWIGDYLFYMTSFPSHMFHKIMRFVINSTFQFIKMFKILLFIILSKNRVNFKGIFPECSPNFRFSAYKIGLIGRSCNDWQLVILQILPKDNDLHQRVTIMETVSSCRSYLVNPPDQGLSFSSLQSYLAWSFSLGCYPCNMRYGQSNSALMAWRSILDTSISLTGIGTSHCHWDAKHNISNTKSRKQLFCLVIFWLESIYVSKAYMPIGK